MTIKYSMKFKIETLVDITETRARPNEDIVKYKQQQNYMTLTQTIGIRVNPIVKIRPIVSTVAISNLGFGSNYKGKHKVWTFFFETESEGSTSVDMIENDLNFVPVILNLEETAKFSEPVFQTTDLKTKNIIINCLDNEYPFF
jgi:hypothetical protein